ncbi:ATP-binding protein [Rhizobium sp. TRM95111]|uniref:ATP-binding protein n=1 Tax=Rhizobium alarense TaxID=2846851 RepID=UPI001F18BE5F|nr:ATP-binding protein [Rhizobium alarense]MCF3639458.1 ATP-binding protein [Rhizobium alarense]
MRSLTTRFAILLIAAISGVIILSAVVTTFIARRPGDNQFGQAMVEKALLALDLSKGDAAIARAAGMEIGPAPAAATIDPPMTERLSELLAEVRPGAQLAVFETSDHRQSTLAVRLNATDWAYLSFPRRPRFPFFSLALYLTFVASGVAGVAILAAKRMTQPFRMVERTILSIGPDGVIPPIEETGPQEVRVTARAMNRLSGRLNAAVESRMRLIAAAGHDLRTPMTRMRLRAEFFEDDAEREAWLKDIDELDRIADSAIRLVREEVSADSRQPLRLDRLVEETARELRDIGLDVSVASARTVTVDAMPLAVKRALRNLATNAAIHGGAGRISVTSEGDTAVVEIVDDGPGIPDALMPRVFEPFFRVDEGRRKFHPGAGLGLAIAREIITNNGGELTLANRPEGGLRQRMTLPLEAAPPK